METIVIPASTHKDWWAFHFEETHVINYGSLENICLTDSILENHGNIEYVTLGEIPRLTKSGKKNKPSIIKNYGNIGKIYVDSENDEIMLINFGKISAHGSGILKVPLHIDMSGRSSCDPHLTNNLVITNNDKHLFTYRNDCRVISKGTYDNSRDLDKKDENVQRNHVSANIPAIHAYLEEILPLFTKTPITQLRCSMIKEFGSDDPYIIREIIWKNCLQRMDE